MRVLMIINFNRNRVPRAGHSKKKTKTQDVQCVKQIKKSKNKTKKFQSNKEVSNETNMEVSNEYV
jgi:hypothetical protein